MAFGKTLLIPVFGFSLFSWLAIIAKNLHNFLWSAIRAELYRDFRRVCSRQCRSSSTSKGGSPVLAGFFSDGHVPSEKFNAGEKVWFWVV